MLRAIVTLVQSTLGWGGVPPAPGAPTSHTETPHPGEMLATLYERFGRTVQVSGVGSKFLWIDDEDASWNVTLSNGESVHSPLPSLSRDPTLSVDIMKKDGRRKIGPAYLQGAWTTALSNHPVTDPGEAGRIYDLVCAIIRDTYIARTQTN